jgi:hypothetical protein
LTRKVEAVLKYFSTMITVIFSGEVEAWFSVFFEGCLLCTHYLIVNFNNPSKTTTNVRCIYVAAFANGRIASFVAGRVGFSVFRVLDVVWRC